jgi:DNA/RNA endonuclease YhcR with UshA esterase domain
MYSNRFPLALLVGLLAFGLMAACDTDTSGPVEIDAVGTVVGLAWLDRNGTGELDGSDLPVRDVTVQLMTRTGLTPLFTATSGATGQFIFRDVPVGDYRAVVDETTVGDTIRILRVDSAHVTVAAGDTSVVLVGFSFPAVSVREARDAPVDTRILVEGLALNTWATFGDATLHVRDATAAIVAVQVPQIPVQPGDSVRIQGTVRTRAGQPVLQDVSVFRLRTGTESPAADHVTARQARLAGDGRLDAALVRLDSVVVRDTTRIQGEFAFVVEDASGTARVLLDRDIPFQLQFPSVVIGTILDVTGLLVPAPTTPGEWVLKPRNTADIVIGPLSFPTMPVADARQQPQDTRLIVNGRALTRWNNFGDATIHVRDRTGAIRAIQVPQTTVQPGDSIQVLGTTATFEGQPVLRFVHTSILEQGIASPTPVVVGTAAAANADAGRLDADLVRLANVVVTDTARTVIGERVLIANDDSGPVRIVLSGNLPQFNPILYHGQIVGMRINATGVLIPRAAGTGEWVVKPRAVPDVEVLGGG